MRVKFEINIPSQMDSPMDGLVTQAFLLGLNDGLQSPAELSSGITYTRKDLSETYDEGVNIGQAMARLYGTPSAKV